MRDEERRRKEEKRKRKERPQRRARAGPAARAGYICWPLLAPNPCAGLPRTLAATRPLCMKELLKKLLKRLPVAFTKNQQYDRDTNRVLRRVLHPTANCVDVGCHKGEVLALMLQQAPQGQHYGFEPIPAL